LWIVFVQIYAIAAEPQPGTGISRAKFTKHVRSKVEGIAK